MSEHNPLFDILRSIYEGIVQLRPENTKDFILNARKIYVQWWISVYNEAPHHVIVETGLILFIVWLFFIRRTVDPSKDKKAKELSEKEIDWLIESWSPEPLVPLANDRTEKIINNIKVP